MSRHKTAPKCDTFQSQIQAINKTALTWGTSPPKLCEIPIGAGSSLLSHVFSGPLMKAVGQFPIWSYLLATSFTRIGQKGFKTSEHRAWKIYNMISQIPTPTRARLHCLFRFDTDKLHIGVPQLPVDLVSPSAIITSGNQYWVSFWTSVSNGRLYRNVVMFRSAVEFTSYDR